MTDPPGTTTRLKWTVEGQPSRRTAPDGTVQSCAYAGEGNCPTRADTMGGATRFTYPTSTC
ncbi:hypothetical protein [Streptomyces candidus]|uniref:YD repeat-containing protein n=1 Tax=Streptomyces candidus TaxID=67283 RepID=A0A7X0LSQ4_9ACTN|nr:hypothetical protein [Streptomyces candidus]MBB6439500.1 YD repeat-containing protein [Streptomyces candidus]